MPTLAGARGVVVLCFVVASASGCRSPADAGATTDAPAAEPAAAADTKPPRRPTKRWYMGRTEERCEVYSIDGETISPSIPAPCPRYLEVGERIRIAGKTCMREATRDPARAVPVVCPDPLTNAEKRDRTSEAPPPP